MGNYKTQQLESAMNGIHRGTLFQKVCGTSVSLFRNEAGSGLEVGCVEGGGEAIERLEE